MTAPTVVHTVDPRWCPLHGMSRVTRTGRTAAPGLTSTVTWWECPPCMASGSTGLIPLTPLAPGTQGVYDGVTAGHAPGVLPQGMLFHAGHLADAYRAGAQSARKHHPVTDHLIERSCDAYVKLAHLKRLDETPERSS